MIGEFKDEFSFLSNFWPAEVVLDEETYPTVEHAFQAAKTLDMGQRELIRRSVTPGQAKRAGRLVTLRQGWDDMRIEVMASLLVQKFRVEPMRTMLLETGDQSLVEGNRWGDVFWGRDLDTGRGMNALGVLLMAIRGGLGGHGIPDEELDRLWGKLRLTAESQSLLEMLTTPEPIGHPE